MNIRSHQKLAWNIWYLMIDKSAVPSSLINGNFDRLEIFNIYSYGCEVRVYMSKWNGIDWCTSWYLHQNMCQYCAKTNCISVQPVWHPFLKLLVAQFRFHEGHTRISDNLFNLNWITFKFISHAHNALYIVWSSQHYQILKYEIQLTHNWNLRELWHLKLTNSLDKASFTNGKTRRIFTTKKIKRKVRCMF